MFTVSTVYCTLYSTVGEEMACFARCLDSRKLLRSIQYTKDENGKAIYAEPIYSYIPEDVGIVSECLATSGALWPTPLTRLLPLSSLPK